jgi:spermidine synthase
MAPEVVMEDSPQELNTHLEFMLKAHGNVLITGLGLGCVLRGTMQNPRVQHVTVIERDLHVVNLVWPFIAPAKPCTLIISDALQWVRRFDVSFDCAWHDLWSDPDKNEPHLQETHMKLVCELHPRIPLQGAWQFPRMFRKVMSPALL